MRNFHVIREKMKTPVRYTGKSVLDGFENLFDA
jgi:hypothetical protein